MKKIFESDNDFEVESTESLSDFLQMLHKAQADEQKAITMYDKILKMSNIPDTSRKMIEELLSDEKDHLVIISTLLADEVEEELSGHGNE